jgi:hypothetical protein
VSNRPFFLYGTKFEHYRGQKYKDLLDSKRGDDSGGEARAPGGFWNGAAAVGKFRPYRGKLGPIEAKSNQIGVSTLIPATTPPLSLTSPALLPQPRCREPRPRTSPSSSALRLARGLCWHCGCWGFSFIGGGSVGIRLSGRLHSLGR